MDHTPMDIRLPNSTIVSRTWGSDTTTELVAVFQYVSDAERFVKLKLSEDSARAFHDSSYIISDTNSGAVQFHRNHKPTTE